jgi:hypothetical protein
LTPSHKPSQGFLWQPGHPAGFCAAASQDLETETMEVLAEHGFFFSKVALHPELVPASGLADLFIEVTALGPAGTLSAIEISGNRKNSEAELRQFLGFKPGMLVTRKLLEEAEQKLWQSGRFRSYELRPQPDPDPGAAPNHIRLECKVAEFDSTPKLTEALSRQEQAMIQLCNWLSAFPSRPQEDAVFSLKMDESFLPGDLDLVLSPKRGVLLQITDSKFRTQGYSYSVLLTPGAVKVFAPRRGSQLLLANSNIVVESFLRLTPTPPEEENRFTFTAGAGWQSVPSSEVELHAPLSIDLTLAPAAFLGLAADRKDAFKIEGRTCSMVNSNVVLEFDARTGRLAEFRSDGPWGTASLRFATNSFDQAAQRLEAGSLPATNRMASNAHPLAAFVGFVMTELAQLSWLDSVTTNLTATERQQAVGALCRLLDPAVLQPLDSGAWSTSDKDQDAFSIPPDATVPALRQDSLLAQLAGVGFSYFNHWFPKYSWPWTMAHESVSFLAHREDYVDAELTRLIKSDSTGPLGCLALASVLSRIGSPAAGRFADRGLSCLRAADFRADCRLLFEGDSGLAKTVANMAEVLRTMPPGELNALVKALPASEARLLRECAEALRATPKGPMATTLAPALDRYWDESLRASVRSKLRSLVN